MDIIQEYIKKGCPITNCHNYIYDIAKWLREKHNLYILIKPEFYGDGINFNVQILCYNENMSESDYFDNSKCTGMYGDNGEFETYKKSFEFGIIKCLKFI